MPKPIHTRLACLRSVTSSKLYTHIHISNRPYYVLTDDLDVFPCESDCFSYIYIYIYIIFLGGGGGKLFFLEVLVIREAALAADLITAPKSIQGGCASSRLDHGSTNGGDLIECGGT